jgi:aldehyde dehydrogenase (NAD+)
MQIINNTYIEGKFIESKSTSYFELINPANEERYGSLLCSSIEDLENAINSAYINQAYCLNLSIQSRKDILSQILEGIVDRRQELAEVISLEIGAPINLSKNAHIQMGIDHLQNTINVLNLLESLH